jgi:hypothetical protein
MALQVGGGGCGLKNINNKKVLLSPVGLTLVKGCAGYVQQ